MRNSGQHLYRLPDVLCVTGAATTDSRSMAMIPEVEARLPCGDVIYGERSSDMARTQYDHLWALAHAERTALAKDLAGLSAEQWRHDTLCGEWDVEQVVAHLTTAASLTSGSGCAVCSARVSAMTCTTSGRS